MAWCIKNSLILDRPLVRVFVINDKEKRRILKLFQLQPFSKIALLFGMMKKMRQLSILVAMRKSLFNVLRN